MRSTEIYLYSVRLDKMHVQRRCVGQNLATAFHRAEDVRPHFFGQLRDGGFYYFLTLRQRLFVTVQRVCRRVIDIIRDRCRGGHVCVLTASFSVWLKASKTAALNEREGITTLSSA